MCRCRDKDVSIAKINSAKINSLKKVAVLTGQPEGNGVSFFWEFHHEFDVHGLAC